MQRRRFGLRDLGLATVTHELVDGRHLVTCSRLKSLGFRPTSQLAMQLWEKRAPTWITRVKSRRFNGVAHAKSAAVSAEKPSIVCRCRFDCKTAARISDNRLAAVLPWPLPDPTRRPMFAKRPAPSTIVLDTNAALDWLVFDNPELSLPRAAILTGAIRWIATSAMREEFGFILEGANLAAWKPDPLTIWAVWDRHCVLRPEPPAGDPTKRPRCSDPDDQMFIDLAIAESARWLVSRDKAVLKLARRLRPFGVEVVTPLGWHDGPMTSPT